jgi:hypothetical protein
MRRGLASDRASAHTTTLSQRERDRFFALGVMLEKRVRNLRLPDVLFTSLTFPFVEFHCQYLRPVICEKGGGRRFDTTLSGNGDEESLYGPGSEIEGARNTRSFVLQDLEDEETLLLHTETGLPLTANHVRSTWKRFLLWQHVNRGQATDISMIRPFSLYSCKRPGTPSTFMKYLILCRRWAPEVKGQEEQQLCSTIHI